MSGPPQLTQQDRENMEFLGLTQADLAPPVSVIDLWPCLAPAFALYRAMQTQWRMGFSGPTGLDYNALPVVEQRLGISPDDAAELFGDVQAMEAAALLHLSTSRPK
jgi:hypothetical protein